MTLANEEASHYNHEGVGTEHILLAIMSEGEKQCTSTMFFSFANKEGHSW
jgi:Clp amino terminal domain, pathogenicity island component